MGLIYNRWVVNYAYSTCLLSVVVIFGRLFSCLLLEIWLDGWSCRCIRAGFTYVEAPGPVSWWRPLSLPLPSPLLPSPPLPSPPLPSPLPLEVGPLIQLGGLGERCKLPQWGLGRSPSRQKIWCIFEPKRAALVATDFVDFRSTELKFTFMLLI